MKLGNFSHSLSVADLQKSKQFYQTLGFAVFHGMEDQGWLIMKNESVIIGLFHNMFASNIMTFNPGWDANAQQMDDFDDVRQIQQKLLDQGIALESKIDETSTEGPASFSVKDPDGNVILFDQHV